MYLTPSYEPVYSLYLLANLKFIHKGMISRQADRYISVAIRSNFLTMVHAVIFRPNTVRAGFDAKQIHVGVLVDKVALAHVLCQAFRTLLLRLSHHSRNQNQCCKF